MRTACENLGLYINPRDQIPDEKSTNNKKEEKRKQK